MVVVVPIALSYQSLCEQTRCDEAACCIASESVHFITNHGHRACLAFPLPAFLLPPFFFRGRASSAGGLGDSIAEAGASTAAHDLFG